MKRLYRFVGLGLLLVLAIPIVTAQTTLLDAPSDTRYQLERVTSANFPVGMVIAPDGRLFYNEKISGNVRVILPDGTLQPEPVITLETDALQERGMLGIALDPDFAENRRMYVVHTAIATARDFPANRLVRFVVDADNRAQAVEELWRLPIETGALLHNGGNVHFDDEGYLFLSVGDYGNPAYGQDRDAPQGAIHRFQVTDAGLVPAEGNPFGDDNSLYAYGLRNPFDFTFDPYGNHLFTTESGPACDDEINMIVAGFNYGWGSGYDCVGEGVITGLSGIYAPPLLSYTPTIAPTGIVVYDGALFPQWQGDLFFCDWNTGVLRRVVLSDDRTRAEAVHEIDLGDVQCRVDLAIGNDGSLYFGTVSQGDGAIWRITTPTD